jgi:hypothetical protein
MTSHQESHSSIAQSDSDAESEILSIDEVTERYYGEWVLMLVTEHDEEHWPSHGKVIAHSHKQEDLNEPLRRLPKDPANGTGHETPIYYTFRAFPLVSSGPEYDKAARAFLSGLFGAKRGRGESAAD